MTEYLIRQLSPLRWALCAYSPDAAPLLGIENPPDGGGAWEAYIAETGETEEEAGTLRDLRVTLHLDAFLDFTVRLALAAELLPEIHAALNSLGGLTQKLAFGLFSASPKEAVSWKILWRRRQETVRLLFGDTEGRLRLRPVVFDYLLGEARPPAPCGVLAPGGAPPAPLAHSGIPRRIELQLAERPRGNMFCLTGAKGSGRKYWLMRYLDGCGGACIRVRPEDVTKEHFADIGAFLVLTGAFLYVETQDKTAPGALIRGVKPANVFIACFEDEPLPAAEEGYTAVPLQTPVLGYAERLAVWNACLPETPEVRAAASRYRFTVGQILDASRFIKEGAGNNGQTAAALHAACKRQLTHELHKLSQKTRQRYTWNDLILPPRQIELLRHIRDRVLCGETVLPQGLNTGVRALFSGPPGTGKTMAAQILARELDMEMYTVNLSALVSKYIGETEKNLEAVFTEAAKSAGILFFDEADALFGKRGEQKDSHDKYANMQTAYLLQRFESYGGVALLATNLTSNLDPAFLRRVQVRVDFPAPDADMRRLLWESVLKSSRIPPRDDVDTRFLAGTFELTGSAIRNIVLTAAFMAAAKEGEIGMRELIRAVSLEYAKLDKVLTPRELGDYGELLEA
ncbi:MAG: AAA family ATPase [Oscillospiraceae bacterium]|jgi:hypothetical protein|nr:AAA family ATPase [Oscillospiraceae bacterium]